MGPIRAILIYSGGNRSPTVLQSAFPLCYRIPAYHKAPAQRYAVRIKNLCWDRVWCIEYQHLKGLRWDCWHLASHSKYGYMGIKIASHHWEATKIRPYSGREKTLRPYRVQKLRNAKLSLAEPNEKLTKTEYHTYSRNVWHNCELFGSNEIKHPKNPWSRP